jgi:hypothetical protein
MEDRVQGAEGQVVAVALELFFNACLKTFSFLAWCRIWIGTKPRKRSRSNECGKRLLLSKGDIAIR